MNSIHATFNQRILLWAPMTLAIALFATGLGSALPAGAADSVGDKVSAVTADTEKKVQEVSQTAQTKMSELWRRIDQQRLTNRTPDQIVAWVIMGLLVSGLIHQFSKLNRFTTLLLGLAGSFIGGIAASVSGLDLGLGPVLIRYEELIASLIGGLLIVLVGKMLASRRSKAK